jgi:hypothetical protein
MTGTLSAGWMGVAGGVALAALLAARRGRAFARPVVPGMNAWLWAFAAAIGARLLAQVWLFGPGIGDVLGYHLPKLAEWMRAGGFTREMGPDPLAALPAGFEIIEAWWAVFIHHDVLIEMAGVEFLLLAFAGTRSLGRSVGLDDRAACVAGLIAVLTPGLHLQATACLNDGPAAALVAATAALAAARVHPSLLLIPVGLGLGMKGTYAFALPGVALFAFLVRREAAAAAPRKSWAVGLAVLAAAVGGFWYVRNALWYGNPVHPVTAGGVQVRMVTLQAGPSLFALGENLRALLGSRMDDHQEAYGAMLKNIAGWGWVGFACGIPALIVGAREDVRVRRLALGFAVSLVSVLLFVASDPYSLRFVLFFPIVLAVAVARIEARRFVRIIAVPALLIQFASTTFPSNLPPAAVAALARQGWRERSLAPLLGASPPAPAVGLCTDYRNVAYLLYRPDYSTRVVYLGSKDAGEMVADMRRAGLRYVYCAFSETWREEDLRLAVERGALRASGRWHSLPDP